MNTNNFHITSSAAELDSVPLFQYFTDNGKKPIEMNIDINNLAFTINDNFDINKEIIDEEKVEYNRINDEIDLIYEKGGFREGQLHAALSGHKYYYAGEAVYNFFTDDSINSIIIGESSGGMRNHTIFKCRKRNMVFEVHYGHGVCDIFPFYGIMEYLEAYSPVFSKREEWMKLSNNLPNYDMVPLSKD